MICGTDEYINICRRASARALKKRVFEELLAGNESLAHDASPKGSSTCSRNSSKRNDYWSYSWGRMLRSGRCDMDNTREGRYFRRRFRVPYPLFAKLVQVVRDSGHFSESHRSAPLEVRL